MENASLSRGFIGSVCNLQKYSIAWVLIYMYSVIGNLPSSDLAEILHTWYSFIGNIFKELDLEITDFENFTRPFASIKHSPKKNIKKVINDSYSKKM
jgi:hypothetical protein